MSKETDFSVKRDLAAFAAALASKSRRVRVSLSICCWRNGDVTRVGDGNVTGRVGDDNVTRVGDGDGTFSVLCAGILES